MRFVFAANEGGTATFSSLREERSFLFSPKMVVDDPNTCLAHEGCNDKEESMR